MEPYKLTKEAWGEHQRAIFKAKSVPVEWDDLQVDDVIVDSSNHYHVYAIHKIAPKRGYMLAEYPRLGTEVRMNRKAFDGHKLLRLSPALAVRVFLDHEESVKSAIAQGDGLERWQREHGHPPKVVIPPEVKYDYPALFSPMPAEWDEHARYRANSILDRANETWFGSPFRPAAKLTCGLAEHQERLERYRTSTTIKDEVYRQQCMEHCEKEIAEHQWALKHVETTIGLEAGGINTPDPEEERERQLEKRRRKQEAAPQPIFDGPRYRACSGQGRGLRSWSVCDEQTPSWRPLTANGRVRVMGAEAAKKLAEKYNNGELAA